MSRARVHRHPTEVRKRVFLVTAEMAVLLPLSACLAAGLGEERVVEFRGALADPHVAPTGVDAGPHSATFATTLPDEDETAEDETDAASSLEHPASLSGYVMGRSRSRWNDDVDDHDIYGVAGVDITTSGEDPFKIHLVGRGAWDTDGESGGSTYFGVDDTYDSRLTGRLYQAHVDAPLGDGFELARLGRQTMYETPATAYFDGVRLESAGWGPAKFAVGVYGGVPVHQFESSSGGDVIGGVYTTFRPWEQGRVRIEWMHLEDETRLGEHENDLLSIGLRHRVGHNLRLEGNYSRLEDENRDMALKGLWTLPEQQLTVRASHYRLLEPEMDLANELNPFFNSLITSQPFDQNQLQISKGFGEWIEIAGGFDVRRVDDEGDIGRYNRDFDRYYVSAILLELLPLDTTLTVTAESWDSPDSDIETWGVDLDSELDEGLRASLGSYYTLFKYFLDLDSERENVRTYYAEIRKAMSDSTDLSARYEYEDEELGEYHTLRVGVTWRF